MKQSLSKDALAGILAPLKAANKEFNSDYSGLTTFRQPIHTLYGGAHLFKSDVARKMSEGSLASLRTHAPNGSTLKRALKQEATSDALWNSIYARISHKLESEALEDMRIDFEDGYGSRPDAEEDGHAENAALEVAKGMRERSLPPFIGIRVKPFNDENVTRSTRTLDIFLSTLLSASGGKLPEGFVVTLPKITITEQARTLTRALTAIEAANNMKRGEIKFEIMVETTQAIFDKNGRTPLREFVAAGEGRCIGAHFGTYDYTAGCNITAAYQMMMNPVCDFAKHVLQVSLAGMPLMISDGATNIMPVGPHKATPEAPLTKQQLAENESVVHSAWRLSFANIRHSLETGYYQGWDLHPAQFPVRYAAVYSFFLESLEPASQRLKTFVDKAAKATLLGDIFDDAATGQGLLNFFLRGMSCGAITEGEALRTGLTLEELRGRSFMKIVNNRR